MNTNRYRVLDSYTTEELMRMYRSAGSLGRIALLKKFSRDALSHAPFELECLAVEDTDPIVRQWVARHGYLDHRGAGVITGTEPEKDLYDKLLQDPDSFVRASSLENPRVTGYCDYDDLRNIFDTANHIERLALIRNPEIWGNPLTGNGKLILEIFDLASRIKLTLSERKDLVRAYLSIPRPLRQWLRGDEKVGYTRHTNQEFCSSLWTLIQAWPDGETFVKAAVYRTIWVPDDTRAEIYRMSADSNERVSILGSADSEDIQTLKLGRSDKDYGCREIAYSKTKRLSDAEINAALEEYDEAALCGLGANRWLPFDVLEKIKQRLDKDADEFIRDSSRRVIARTMKLIKIDEAKEKATKAFFLGWDELTLDEKIDFLAGKLAELGTSRVTEKENTLRGDGG